MDKIFFMTMNKSILDGIKNTTKTKYRIIYDS
jgi:hypothetical protein